MNYLLGWSCFDECEYDCMWKTLNIFQKNDISVPQFNGKWPFLRIGGFQEPLSALASLLNLLPHVFFLTSKVKTSRIWTLYALLSVNTWFWSFIYHARETKFTEIMDYLSAFSIVVYSLVAFILRFSRQPFGLYVYALLLSILAFFTQHVYYMAYVSFDYGYNMLANVGVGALNSICWLSWSLFHRKHYHVRFATLSILLLDLTILFELGDFPPLGWILDSHALWHISTIPIHYLWYHFVRLDYVFLMTEKTTKE